MAVQRYLQRSIGAARVKWHLGALVRAVHETGERIVITHQGKEVAAIVSAEEFQILRRATPEQTARIDAWLAEQPAGEVERQLPLMPPVDT